MSETCWARNKWNKIASDIKLVFHSSTIAMMHGPINFRLVWTCSHFRPQIWAPTICLCDRARYNKSSEGLPTWKYELRSLNWQKWDLDNITCKCSVLRTFNKCGYIHSDTFWEPSATAVHIEQYEGRWQKGKNMCDRDNYVNEDIDRKLLPAKEDFKMLTKSMQRPKNKFTERQNS